MFPFVVDHRATLEPSLALYRATKSAFKSNSRGRSSSDSSPSTNTTPAYPSASRNSFRNPYSFMPSTPLPRSPSSSTSTKSSSPSPSSSRLAAINSSWDDEYGTYSGGDMMAEEIRERQAAKAARELKDLEAGSRRLPPRSATNAASSTRSSTSSSASSSASGSDEDTTSPKRRRRRFTSRLFRRKTRDADDQEMLVSGGEVQ